MAENIIPIPRVSVCLPTYNRGRFIAQAIDSVLKQSFTDWELIIVDDGSTDNTEFVIAPFLSDPRITYLKNEVNRHISFTRNRALDKARGEYIAVLDSDDYWTNLDKIAKQVKFLDEHRDYLVVGTRAEAVNPENKLLKQFSLPLSDREIRDNILGKNPIIHSTVLYRRAAVLAIGKYNLELNGIEDYDLWLRLGTVGKLANLADMAVAYRIHPNNIVQTDRLRLMRTNLSLIRKNWDKYPGYFRAYWRRKLRLSAYLIFQSIFHFLPKKVG
ncbi:MAG: glycosyltransferase [Candidatus Vogelbacteria bacterium]|nr:glycosyltransferase [Candidatus Vogelbacteria bacterium]